MSTDLATIRSTPSTNAAEPISAAMDITSFFGGAERGPCLQVRIDDKYVQLNVSNAAYARDVFDAFVRKYGVSS